MAEPYDTFMETVEKIADVGPVVMTDPTGDHGFSVIVQIGSAVFIALDTVTVEVDNNADFSSPISVTTTPVSLLGTVQGQYVRLECEFDPDGSYGPWYYRVKFSTIGGTRDDFGTAREFALSNPAATEGRDLLSTDSHDGVIVNGINGLCLYPAETRIVQKHTYQLMRDRVTAIGRQKYREVLCNGDMRLYVSNVGEQPSFPTLHNGTGERDPAATSGIALDEADVHDVSRAFFLNNPEMPAESVPHRDSKGNHDGAFWHQYAANNAGASNLGALAHAKHRAHGGIPAGTLTMNPATTYRGRLGEASGEWYAFLDGNVLKVVPNPCVDSATTESPLPSPLPVTLFVPSDHKFGATQEANLKTLILAYKDSVDWIFIDIHNLPGGVTASNQNPRAYGRADKNWILYGYWASFHTWLVANVGPNKVIVFLGHDHRKSHGYKDGILYYWMGTPGNAAGQTGSLHLGISYGPWNLGFHCWNENAANQNQANRSALHRIDAPLFGAMYHERHWTKTWVKLRTFRSVVDTAPVSFLPFIPFGITQDGQMIEELTFPQDFLESGKLPEGLRADRIGRPEFDRADSLRP